MRPTSYAMSDGIEDASVTPVLIAPAAVMAVVDALNLELGSRRETFPEPLPASGLVVCLPGMPIPVLPPGWAGVWARPEIPPAGAWVPLPDVAVTDPQALGHGLARHARRRLSTGSYTPGRDKRLRSTKPRSVQISRRLLLTRTRLRLSSAAGDP